MFMKIGENDSTHKLVKMLFKIDFIFILMIYTYKLLKPFPLKHLENSSAPWAIFFFII